MNLRKSIIRALLTRCHTLQGDLYVSCNEKPRYKLSCVFVFYKRFDLLTGALECLQAQNLPREHFEIILVEDRGGSEDGRKLIQHYPAMNIFYTAPTNQSYWGKMGAMRNEGIAHATGEIILFLDDDTVILDPDFLEKLYAYFEKDQELQAILPRGYASFCLLEHKYQYHDPFFFTNRCVAYKRSCLIKLGGFRSNFIGQEDVEFAIRFLAMKYKYLKVPELKYYHPPLLVSNLRKPQAVGYSFAKSPYPLWLKLFLAMNGSRWLYRWLYPNFKNQQMGRFAVGFLTGFLQGLAGSKKVSYA